MRRSISVTGLYRDKLGNEVFEAIARIAPEGVVHDNVFRIALDSGDPRLGMIESCLAGSGWAPRQQHGRERMEHAYGRSCHWVFEDSDLRGCEYLSIYPRVPLPERERKHDGLRFLEVRSTDPPLDFIGVEMFGWVVTTSLKEEIERGAGERVVFERIRVETPGSPTPAQEVWVMDTLLTLPWMADGLFFFGPNGLRLERGDGRSVLTRNDPDVVGLAPQYYTDELRRSEPFDLGRSYEDHGGHRIASKRLFEVLRGRGCEVGWSPVRLIDRKAREIAS